MSRSLKLLIVTFWVAMVGSVYGGRAIIVLDGSGSMWGQIKGEAKIDIAKRVVGDLLETIGEDVELGLMCYGHRRKGDCEDIEMLIPPGKVDRKAFREVVNGILPKGKTPLTDAVERAALELRYIEEAADVILVSDGIETCDRDPCELAKKLAAAGVGFRTHVVAFDLTAEEAQTIRCLADETGGAFLPAQDAATLQDALGIVVDRVAVPAGRTPEEEEEVETPDATLVAAEVVGAGGPFEVEWTGPDGVGDYITVVEKTARDGHYGNYAYTKRGNPAVVTAPIDAGDYELRYMWSERNRVAARRDIRVTPVEATLKVSGDVTAGSPFGVEWTGPKQQGDFITIVAPGAEDRAYNDYVYAKNVESPAMIRAVDEAGDFEVRYVSGQKNRILARAAVQVLPAAATLRVAKEVAIGSDVEVVWTGPANQGDFITMVKPDAEGRAYNDYVYTKGKSGPVTIRAVERPGSYELRYVTGQENRVLARVPVEVVAVDVTLKFESPVTVGAPVSIDWTGPGNKQDYVTIVEKGARKGSYGSYEYAKQTPLVLTAPETPGVFDVWYVTGGEKQTIASKEITVEDAKATLKAASKVAAGGKLEIEWTGPANKRDYVTIVAKGARKGTYGSYEYVKPGGGAVSLSVPEKPGEYEIWYVMSVSKRVLTSLPVEVVGE